jgi:hypothetical protein
MLRRVALGNTPGDTSLHSHRRENLKSYNVDFPQQDDVKYLGLKFDRRLAWHKHIFTKRKQLGMTLTKMHWLLGRKTKLSTRNKILIFKAILKPIWTYGIQLWGMASTSGIEILESFQFEVDDPWYMPNTIIRRDLQRPTVKKQKSVITALNSVLTSVLHPNDLVVNLMGQPDNRR